MSLTLDGTTGISTTGNIVGNNISVTGAFAPTNLSATGNVQGGNLLTPGNVSAAGNVTGNYLLGNGTFITGLSASKIFNGTSEANIGTSGGNANITIGGTSNVVVFSTAGISVIGTVQASGTVTGGNISTTGTATIGGFTISGNTIVSSGSTLTIDPNTSGGVDGLVVIAGNLQVNGNTTTINSNVVSTNDLTINFANNAINSAAANGGGIEVGPIGSPFITWLYNNTANVWATAGGISATGNITGGNVSGTAGTFTNVTGALQTAAQTNITSVGTLTALAVTGNITSGNLSGTSIVGTLTTAAQTNITSVGTLTALAVSGNASSGTAAADTNTTQLATTAFVIGQASAATPTSIGTNTVGTSLRYARADHTHTGVGSAVAGTGIGVSAATGAVTITNTGVTALTTSSGLSTNTSATGAVSITNTGVTSIVAGTNISVSGATGAVTVNVSGTVASATTAGTVTTAAQPNITSVGTLSGLTINNATTAITNGATSGSGNIGAAGATFNTIFAKATTAQYADLAEVYTADATYLPGTVVMFGGTREITVSSGNHNTQVAGIISTQPAYLMNSTLSSEYTAAVALTGRVPCKVVGIIHKGDRLVASAIDGVAGPLDITQYQPGCIIGKALEEWDSGEIGTIEVAVGRT